MILTIGGGSEPKSSWAPSHYLNQMCLLHLGKEFSQNFLIFVRG
jgi:hypothetical protein